MAGLGPIHCRNIYRRIRNTALISVILGEGKEPARVRLDSCIEIFITTRNLPALAFCRALGSSSAARWNLERWNLERDRRLRVLSVLTTKAGPALQQHPQGCDQKSPQASGTTFFLVQKAENLMTFLVDGGSTCLFFGEQGGILEDARFSKPCVPLSKRSLS